MPGAYRPDAGDPAEADALAEPLWELALAGSHYHPHVAASSQSIAKIPPEGGSVPHMRCPQDTTFVLAAAAESLASETALLKLKC